MSRASVLSLFIFLLTQLQWPASTEGFFMQPFMPYMFPSYQPYYGSCSPCGCNQCCHHEHSTECPNPKEGCCSDGKLYQEGYTWTDGQCKKCICHNGKFECENHCCHMNGTEYQHGDTWVYNNCKNCTCCHGNINCKDTCCRVNGYLYEDNEKFLLRHCHGCHKPSEVACKCKKGDVHCIDRCFGTCYAHGDPHYLTFDGRYFDFQGNCRYIHAMDCDNSIFRVEVQNTDFARTRRVTAVKEAFIYLIYREHELCGYDDKRKEEEIEFLLSGIQINGVQVTLPVHVDTLVLKYSITEMYYGVYFYSISHNIRVFWSASRHWVRVYAGYSHFGRLCGLCGNFDGNENNDVSINNGPVTVDQFGSLWRSKGPQQSTCVLMAEALQLGTRRRAERRPGIAPGIPFPCNQRKDGATLYREALGKCAQLRNPPPCCNCGYEHLRKEDVFYRACIYDYCSCYNREKCLKDAIHNFKSLGQENVTVADKEVQTAITPDSTTGAPPEVTTREVTRFRTIMNSENLFTLFSHRARVTRDGSFPPT